MYTLGDNWNNIYKICREGLKDDPDDELLCNVMKVLRDHDEKYGIRYTITTGTIRPAFVNAKDTKVK